MFDDVKAVFSDAFLKHPTYKGTQGLWHRGHMSCSSNISNDNNYPFMYKTSFLLLSLGHTPPTNQTHCYMYRTRSDMSDCHRSCDTLSPDQSNNQLLLKWALTWTFIYQMQHPKLTTTAWEVESAANSQPPHWVQIWLTWKIVVIAPPFNLTTRNKLTLE